MNRCPSDWELVEYCATSDSSAASAAGVGQHVQGCVPCQREVAELRNTTNLLRAVGSGEMHPESACLDDLAIAALAEGGLGSTARQPVMVHLLSCGRCRQPVADVSRLLRNQGVSAEIRTLEALPERSARGRRWIRMAGGLAAAAVVALVVRSVGMPRVREPVLREEPITLLPAPVLLQPTGTIARVDSLSWRSVPRATQYRLTLFTQEGATAWETETGDTAVALPAAVQLVPGASYFWKVEASTDWNRWTASEMVEIRIRRVS